MAPAKNQPHPYLVLLRGINVGGKNKVPMAELRSHLEELGYDNVQTYIASGNAIVESKKKPATVAREIEKMLPKKFKLDSDLVRTLVLTREELNAVVADAPRGFGKKPDTYHSDAVFVIGVSVDDAFEVFDPREGVDKVWKGPGLVYSQRLSAERTKSRMGKIAGTPPYKELTIRSWQTVLKLQTLMDER